jgi:hypothetical protein
MVSEYCVAKSITWFWEELIAYFPWYDTGHIEKDTTNNYAIVACVFVSAVTFLPSRCLAKIGGFLPSRSLTTRGYTYRRTDWWEGFSKLGRWDTLRCRDIRTKFHKDCFRHSKVNGRGITDTHTQTAWWSHKPTCNFSKWGTHANNIEIDILRV